MSDHYLKKELYNLIQNETDIFDFIQSATLDGLWYWDLETPENEWMNPTFWRVLGYDPEKMPHKTEAWQNIINSEDLEKARELIGRHLEDPSKPYEQVIRYTHRDGHTVYIHCRGLAIHDDEGRPVRMLGAHSDITAQQRARMAAEWNQRFYSSILENQSAYILIVDDLRNILYCNRNFYQRFNLSHVDALGRPVSDVITHDSGDKSITDLVTRAVSSPGERFHSVVGTNLEAERIYIDWEVFKAVDDISDIVSVVCVGIDITENIENRQSLERAYNLLEQTSLLGGVGGWEVDLTTSEIIWSEMTCRIHEMPSGYRPGFDEAVAFYHKDDRPLIEALINDCIKTEAKTETEARLITATGREIWVKVHAYPEMRNGEPQRLYGTIQNITTQRNKVEKLKELNRSREQLMGIISHDLRNPASLIVSLAELITESVNDNNAEGLKKYSEMIENAGTRLLDLLNDLLTWAQFQKGSMPFQPVHLNSRDLVETVTESYDSVAEDKKISIKNRADQSLYIQADRKMIEVVLRNLLSNAIKFSYSDSQIIIETHENIETGQVIISVKDSGKGMSPEQINDLFFSQKSFSTKGTAGETGTGLGLVLCKEFVERNNGTLSVESEPGQGSVFSVALPAV